MATTPQIYPAACVIAARQHHLITWTQLLEAGVTEQHVRQWVQSGMLRRVERAVYLLPGGQLTWRARLLALCLTTGGMASHRSAGALSALDGCRPGAPEITIPRGQSFRRPGVRVHESTDLHHIAVTRIDGIPVTPVARTVLDLGAVAPNLVERAMLDAVERRLTTWPELFSTLVAHSRRGRRGCGPLRAMLDAHYGAKAESKLERRFLHLVRESGLPLPVQQLDVTDEHGFIMRLDFAYPDLRIAIELDGAEHHATAKAFERDPIARNRLKIAGWLLLEFTHRRLQHAPVRVCEDVAAAIRSRTPSLDAFVLAD